MDKQNVRKIQMALLEIAKDIDKLCRKHGITYWLTSGNLLGYVRHKGFIPWDDDLDICLLPDDFQRLRKVIKEELIPEKPHYLLYNDYRPANFGEYLADTRYAWNKFYPIKVDLIQFKALPNDEKKLAEDKERVKMMAFLYQKQIKDSLSFTSSNLIQTALIEGSWWKRRERYADDFHAYISRCNQPLKENVFQLAYGCIFAPRMQTYHAYQEIFPVQEIEFEGVSFYAPADIHTYLVRFFGEDYITPPPEHQRRPMHSKMRKAIFPSMMKWNLRVLYALKLLKNAFVIQRKVKRFLKEKE